jgi:hypothetical protein
MSFPDVKIYTLDIKPEGTVYFELLPRKFEDECWNKDSIYIDEDVFYLIEKVFINSIPDYDHYAFTEVGKDEIQRVIDGLNKLFEGLEGESFQVGELFVNNTIDYEVEAGWDVIKPNLKVLCKELSNWLLHVLESRKTLTVLGI